MHPRARALVLTLLLVTLGAVTLSVALRLRRPFHLPNAHRVLVFDVPGEVDEGPPPPSASPPLDFLRRDRPMFHELLFAVRNAAEDASVAAIVLHIDGLDWGWARVAELADALRAFRAAGKPVYASLAGGGEKEYLLAATAGTVAMAPVATLQLDGLSASALFLRGTYEKLDIRPNFQHVGRYKSAVETYTRTGLSPEAREAMQSLLQDQYDDLTQRLAAARSLEPAQVRQLIEGGPYPASRARALGLLDTLLSQADVDSLAARQTGERLSTESLLRYAQEGGAGVGEHIALLVAEGEIVDGRSREAPFGGRSVGDRTLVEALREIRGRKSVRAVVLRIDSPGGSGDASDAVWQELRRLRREKPLIVSMGDVAASGGYYLACAGDVVLANRGTITGSIGVFGGKLNVLGLFRKLGLNVETVKQGRHADMWSPYRDFDDEERKLYQSNLEEFYRVFVSRVAEGRRLAAATVDSVGHGRVWSGSSAVRLGLVDREGGLEEAFELARERAGIAKDADLVVDVYPRPRRTWIQRWLGGLFDEQDPQQEMRLPVVTELGRWYRLAGSAGAMLALMPYTIRID
jgi:protease-4